MTTRTLTGYKVNETEKAVAFVSQPLTLDMKPLWVPKGKIVSSQETDGYSPSIQLKGESIRRFGVPVELVVDEAFLNKIGV